MPERAESARGAPLRELHFVKTPPSNLAHGDVAVDTRQLSRLGRAHAERWRNIFIDWLGALNRQNASLDWWAYTSTAKNMLSSPLGDECFAALALDRFLRETGALRVFVVDAAPAQQAAVAAGLARGGRWRVAGLKDGIAVLEPLARLAWQFCRLLALWVSGSLRGPPPEAAQAVLFTYVDGGFREGPDAFFGTLSQALAARTPPVSACHVAFVHSGYRATLPKLAATEHASYEALFSNLRLADLLWGLRRSLVAWWRAGRYEAPDLSGIPATPLLRAALRWDLGKGGYLYNVLVYRAARRLLARLRPQWLIYPFENKALEKALLLAARERQDPPCRIVGFQHTSITRRHATLLFSEGEANITPLPDRIVTAGEVTRRFLERHGRYPAGIFATGCALRQQRSAALPRRGGTAGEARVLLALSSSRRELVEAVDMCRLAMERGARFELGIRPHPEFALKLLPDGLRDWVGRNARDFSGTSLASNLEWCDCVAYVSSTVALEALGRGRPVINLRISDVLDPDPLLDPLGLHLSVDGPETLAAAIRAVLELDAAAYESRCAEALEYVARYFREPTAEALDVFVPA